jgi:hypothetical protein
MGDSERLADAERGITTSDAETEQPVTMARVTGAELLRQMRELADTVTVSVGSSPSICHISSQGPAPLA